MKVMVRRDSATCTPTEVNDEQLRKLIAVHGAENVTNEDGSPVELPAEVAAPKKGKKKE